MNLDKLNQPLDAGRIKQRTDGRGGSLSYLETHDVIRAANDIFGFGRWGHEVVDLRTVGTTTVHNKDKKPGISIGYVCIVRLTVEGCVPVSGVGFGDATEYRESAPVTAHELAAKEAESDALKRALKNYGDQFGLALYDKDAAKSGHISPSARADSPPAGRGQAAGDTEGSAVPAATSSNGAGGVVLKYGDHAGKTLADAPRDYLEWMLENGKGGEWLQGKIREYLTEAELAGVGAVETPSSFYDPQADDGIPFVPTIDGLGN